MLNRNTNDQQTAEPTYIELETVLRGRISRYIDSQPDQWKEERCLLPFVPSIPQDEDTRRGYIDAFVNPFEEGHYTEAELKEELLDRIQAIGLDVNPKLATRKLQAAVKEQLERMTDEERLQAGVYGFPFTAEDVERTKAMQISYFLRTIKEVAFNASPDQIAAALQMKDSESVREWQERIAKEFPNEVQAVREAFTLQQMGYNNRDRIKMLKSKNLL